VERYGAALIRNKLKKDNAVDVGNIIEAIKDVVIGITVLDASETGMLITARNDVTRTIRTDNADSIATVTGTFADNSNDAKNVPTDVISIINVVIGTPIMDAIVDNSVVAVGGEMVERVVKLGDDVIRDDVVENTGESVTPAARRVVIEVVVIGIHAIVFVIRNSMAIVVNMVRVGAANVVMEEYDKRPHSNIRTITTVSRPVVMIGKRVDIPASVVSTITTDGK
jgi:hypothetical protein